MNLYDVITLDIRVFSNAQVLAALNRNLPDAGGRLCGCWVSDIGELSRVMVLREFAASDELLDARQRMLLAANPLGVGEWATRIESQTYAMFPFLPRIEPAKLGGCYEMRTYHLKQGGLAPTIEAWKAAVPARHAMSPLVGATNALDGGIPWFLNIWAYQSTDERNRIRAESVKQGLWPPKGGPAWLSQMNSTIYLPASFSPLQ